MFDTILPLLALKMMQGCVMKFISSVLKKHFLFSFHFSLLLLFISSDIMLQWCVLLASSQLLEKFMEKRGRT